jgi:prepilin-type N-terminal cleavage/methylation domain-containing protein
MIYGDQGVPQSTVVKKHLLYHKKVAPMLKSLFCNNAGLTLLEILIVVILMSIIAAVAVPRLSTSTDEAQVNTLDTNLSALRYAIEQYAAQHNSRFPGQYKETDGTTTVTTDAEALSAFTAQLTTYSDRNGKTSVTKDVDFPFGPYFRGALPKNPLPVPSNTVVADFDEVGSITNTGAVDGSGWKVAVQTGLVIANNDQYDDR